jgi:hypothetical protein
MDPITTAANSPAQTGANALVPGSEPAPAPIAVAPAPAGNKPIGAREAARSLASWRHNRAKPKDQQQDGAQRHGASQMRVNALTEATPAAAAAAASDPAQESTAHPSSPEDGLRRTNAGDAGEPQAPPGEIESADPAANLPSIEPPRSWTKEDKELFASLPRETQERLAERERSRDSDFSRRQTKATEEAQALAAARQQAEQTRQHYEVALPLLLVQLQQQQAGEFVDIKSVDDLQRLATDDPFRFGKWQAHQMRIATVAQQVQDALQRQENEARNKFAEFAKREDDLLSEKIPDLADKDKASRLQDAAIAVLEAVGFTRKELGDSYNGKLGLQLRDHRVQLLVHDAMLWRDAQAKAKAASAATVPPVQRPGVSQPRGAARDAQIQNLTKRLETSGSLKDAAALLRARRAAR